MFQGKCGYVIQLQCHQRLTLPSTKTIVSTQIRPPTHKNSDIWYNITIDYNIGFLLQEHLSFLLELCVLDTLWTNPFAWRHGPAGDSPRHLVTSSPPINASCVSKWAVLGLPVQQKELQFNSHHLVRSRNAPHTTLGVRSRNTGPTRRGLEYSWSPGMHLAHV